MELHLQSWFGDRQRWPPARALVQARDGDLTEISVQVLHRVHCVMARNVGVSKKVMNRNPSLNLAAAEAAISRRAVGEFRRGMALPRIGKILGLKFSDVSQAGALNGDLRHP